MVQNRLTTRTMSWCEELAKLFHWPAVPAQWVGTSDQLCKPIVLARVDVQWHIDTLEGAAAPDVLLCLDVLYLRQRLRDGAAPSLVHERRNRLGRIGWTV